MSEADSLSADELRARLYHSMKEKGLVDALKSQLRNKLVTELKTVGLSKAISAAPEPTYSREGSLLHKAANSVVADHMRRCHYDYSLSVFLPETGNTQDKIFTPRDLLQLLNISPHSKLYQSLASHSNHQKKGFLWQMLCELASLHGLSSRDAGAQTDPVALPPVTSLEEQFRKLDNHYSTMGDTLKDKMFVEERILHYQHQLDERSRTEIQLECARFKENELARMRMEEREAMRQEVDKLRKEMEKSYQSKMGALSERERHATERLQKIQEMADKETFSQRQQILDEINTVRQKESQLKRQEEINAREKSLWEEKIKTSEILIKKREEDLRRKEIEYEQKLHDERKKLQLEEQSKYLDRTANLEVREARVKEDERRLFEELRSIDHVKDELKEKRNKVNELEAEMIRVQHNALKAEKNSELLGDKVREMVDYQILKEENVVLKKEVESLKTRISELTRDNMVERQKQEELLREMSNRAGKPTPEVYFMQQQVEKMQNELRQERVLAEHQKRQSETRLQEEINRNKDILMKFEEQSLQKREMAHEMTDLRDLLGDTKHALNNEVYRKPHGERMHNVLLSSKSFNMSQLSHQKEDLYMCGSLLESFHSSIGPKTKNRKKKAKVDTLDRSSSLCDLSSDSPGPVDANLLQTHAHPSNLYSTRAPAGRETSYGRDDSDDYSYSFDLVKETKYRLKNLEKEAENLEQHYRNFQTRMTSVDTYLDPVRVDLNSPSRSKVTFQDHLGASPPLAGSRNVTSIRNDVGTPLASTPSRTTGRNVHSTINTQASNDILNASVSTVQSQSPRDERDQAAVQNRPLSMDDLEARPGSPTVVHFRGSNGSANEQPPDRISPSGEEGTSSKTLAPTISLDDAWKQPSAISLDNAWKQNEEEKEAARRREEEDREYEERRRQREEERRRRDMEAREREAQKLREMEEQTESSKPTEVKKQAETKESDDDGIDPVMKQYMEMVAKQREKQKQEKSAEDVAQKTVDTWSKGIKQSATPSHSEHDFFSDDDKSLGALEKPNAGGAPGSDEDFW